MLYSWSCKCQNKTKKHNSSAGSLDMIELILKVIISVSMQCGRDYSIFLGHRRHKAHFPRHNDVASTHCFQSGEGTLDT